MKKKKVVIIGALGYDFHVFFTVFKDNEEYDVVAFTIAGEQNVGTIEGAGYTDFDVAVWSFSEITETYQGIATWEDERWTWAAAGNAVEGETLLTAYKDLDISAAMTADTSHIMIALWRLEPGGGLVDDVFFMNTRTLE